MFASSAWLKCSRQSGSSHGTSQTWQHCLALRISMEACRSPRTLLCHSMSTLDLVACSYFTPTLEANCASLLYSAAASGKLSEVPLALKRSTQPLSSQDGWPEAAASAPCAIGRITFYASSVGRNASSCDAKRHAGVCYAANATNATFHVRNAKSAPRPCTTCRADN